MIDIINIIRDYPIVEQMNLALGRKLEFDTKEEQRGSWKDTEQISLPTFLSRIVRNQFVTKKGSGSKDVLIGSLMTDPILAGSYCVQLASIMEDLLEEWTKEGSRIKEQGCFFSSLAARSNLSEITKQQLLVAAPVLGHPLTGGGHFVHSNPPEGFAISTDRSRILGQWFADKYATSRVTEFTVPASTSQGLILKSRQDSPQWRVYSKALMAELAGRAKSRVTYEEYAQALNLPFEERGFHGPAKDFYLGMRKQASRKGEPVGSRSSFDNSGDYAVQETVAVQGRLRGIFPPSEYVKIFFKPFAEGIKKSLFKYAACTFVDLEYISSKLHYIAYKSYSLGLLQEDETLLCFYDLDKMDTTTHGGFFSIYQEFCNGVFPDFPSVEGNMVKDSGLIFPPSIYSDDVYLQKVDGRSTLSGQPDVTTKNNVCHLLAMAHCIGIVINQDFEEVFHALCEGNVPLKNGVVPVVHIHGDDTMMYFSEKKEDYNAYYEVLASQGFETSCEKSPAFLKKTLCSFAEPTIFPEDTYVLNIQNEILLSKIEDKKNDTTGLLSQLFAAYGVVPNTSEYNALHTGFMNPIAGSLVRNRCGEYEIKDVHLLLMALSDTAKMVDNIAPSRLKDYWHLIFTTVKHEYDLSMVDISSPDIFFSSIQSPEVQQLVRSKLIELASESITKADLIKKTLEKMYYSSGEDFHDDMLETIFGTLFITNIEMSTKFNLLTITTPDLISTIQKYQRDLLDTRGMCPLVDDAIASVANDILRVL